MVLCRRRTSLPMVCRRRNSSSVVMHDPPVYGDRGIGSFVGDRQPGPRVSGGRSRSEKSPDNQIVCRTHSIVKEMLVIPPGVNRDIGRGMAAGGDGVRPPRHGFLPKTRGDSKTGVASAAGGEWINSPKLMSARKSAKSREPFSCGGRLSCHQTRRLGSRQSTGTPVSWTGSVKGPSCRPHAQAFHWTIA